MLTKVLLDAQSAEGSIRKAAEESLKQLQEQNVALFLVSLAEELASEEKPVDSRKLAGLVLKNSLDAKEAPRKAERVEAWLDLDPAAEHQIKVCLLRSLASPASDASHTAAQVIAKAAAIDLPLGAWPDLIAVLLANMGADQSTLLKQASLETLGYVCEEVSLDVFTQEQVNAILTAVVQGMNSSEGSNEVRLAATIALCNALEFAHTNFENDMERDYLMRVVCEATLSPDVRIRQAAFECLVSISTTYYEKLAPYMKDLFAISARAVREDEEAVALQAIEFWSSICDKEIEYQEQYCTWDSGTPSLQFITQALPVLVPLLLETLLKQEEDQIQDEGAWNLAMAGGTCLGLAARTVGNDIVLLVMPFIQENVSKPDWRCREASTYAFGSILEGPSIETLLPLVSSAFNFLLNALKDDNNHVKDTTAWTLSRIFEFLHDPRSDAPLVTNANLPLILSMLLESIKDAPHVAEKVCGAIYFLAQGYENMDGRPSPLSPFLQNIMQSLLATTEREDAEECRLRTSAYETLNEVVRCSTNETDPIVVHLVPVIMQKLTQTLEMQVLSVEDGERQIELQALLCGVLQVIIQKLGGSDSTKVGVVQYADQMMGLFLRVLNCRNATVHEEAMLAIGALAYATGSGFGKYMQEFYKYVEMGLQNYEEYQVCAVTVGVLGDICQALGEKVLPFCDGIMTQLLKDLSSNELHRSVKPPIFSCFGDIALAIGGQFDKYLMYAMPMLRGAAEVSMQVTGKDDETILYTNELCKGILEAFSGIYQGFKNTKVDSLVPYTVHILQFLESIYQDKDRDDAVTRAAIGVLGDVADTLSTAAIPFFQSSVFYKDFLDECMSSDDQQLKETAEWAHMIINHITAG
eukprot:c23110_g1_i1 orf=172-2769(+)